MCGSAIYKPKIAESNGEIYMVSCLKKSQKKIVVVQSRIFSVLIVSLGFQSTSTKLQALHI